MKIEKKDEVVCPAQMRAAHHQRNAVYSKITLLSCAKDYCTLEFGEPRQHTKQRGIDLRSTLCRARRVKCAAVWRTDESSRGASERASGCGFAIDVVALFFRGNAHASHFRL